MSSLRLALQMSLKEAKKNGDESSDENEANLEEPEGSSTVQDEERPSRPTETKKTVPPPTATLRNHVLDPVLARQHVKVGLRVKVKFDESHWYGGKVIGISSNRTKLRIAYDDGTTEDGVTFPDTRDGYELVIDQEGNGTHEADASFFKVVPKRGRPRKPRPSLPPAPDPVSPPPRPEPTLDSSTHTVESIESAPAERAHNTKITSIPSESESLTAAESPHPRPGRQAAAKANERLVERKSRGRKRQHKSEECWVSCNSCNKWRIIPNYAVKSLPEKWYCKDNIYDDKHNSCDAPEQTQRRKKPRRVKRPHSTQPQQQQPQPMETEDDEEYNESEDAPATPRKERSKTRSRNSLDVSSAATTPRRGPGRPPRKPKEENLNWVQCDKCEKWRKLAPHVSADDLPDVWTCDMNEWNPASASCDAPEDKADGLQDVDPEASYRSLIFDVTGKRIKYVASEKLRAAESLYGLHLDDEEPPSRVLYADSSSFVPPPRARQNYEEEGISILSKLHHSGMFQELRNNQKVVYTYETLPKNTQMEKFLLNVLNLQTLNVTELLDLAKDADLEKYSVKQEYLTLNVFVTTLAHMVKHSQVTCVRMRNGSFAFRRTANMKLAKPWKRASMKN